VKDYFKFSNDRPSRPVRPRERRAEPETISRRKLTDTDISTLRELSSELKGKNVLVVNDSLEIVGNVPASRLGSVNARDAFVLMATNATGLVVSNAEKLGSKAVAAKVFGKTSESTVELISL